MGRLTESNGRGGFYFVECFKQCDGEPKDCGNCVENEKICHKLGLYEETGLEPEEVEKLAAFRTPKAPIYSETQDVRLDDKAYIDSMKELCFGEDPELNRQYAEGILLCLIFDLGYEEVVDLYYTVNNWEIEQPLYPNLNKVIEAWRADNG